MACSKKSGGGVTPPPVNPDSPTVAMGLIKLPATWVKAGGYMQGFPEGVEVYHNVTPYKNKALNAYCVVFDPKNSSLDLKMVLPSANKKVTDQCAAESGTVLAGINGGFFGTNASYSLVEYNNTISAINIRSLSRTYNGAATTYYPTRAAFGLTAAGIPTIAWIYHTGAGNGTIYSYPAPSPNALNQAPQQQPTTSFPAGGSVWNAVTAIGGSPVLIVDSVIRLTDTEEMIDIDNTSSRARSALGYTASGKVVILAVEGGNSSGGVGLSLQDLAGLMLEMGCKGAMNLDGGGSTYMQVNGQATVKPSDAVGERPVMGAIILKKK